MDAGDPGAGGKSFKVPKKEMFHGGVDGGPCGFAIFAVTGTETATAPTPRAPDPALEVSATTSPALPQALHSSNYWGERKTKTYFS